MNGVLTAETAVLGELKPVRIVLLVLEGIVVTLLTFGAGQGDFYAHSSVSSSHLWLKAKALSPLNPFARLETVPK